MTDVDRLIAELRDIHKRSRENAIIQGWGVPPAEEDHSPWSRAADALEAQDKAIREALAQHEKVPAPPVFYKDDRYRCSEDHHYWPCETFTALSSVLEQTPEPKEQER